MICVIYTNFLSLNRPNLTFSSHEKDALGHDENKSIFLGYLLLMTRNSLFPSYLGHGTRYKQEVSYYVQLRFYCVILSPWTTLLSPASNVELGR